MLLSSCFSGGTEETASTEEQQVVNIYTDRHYPIDDTLYAKFEKLHNIKVNVVKGKSEDLLSRIEKEGETTKADLLITADVGRLYQAKSAGFFQQIDLSNSLENVPAHLYDNDYNWFGLTKRARIIVYAKDRVEDGSILNYEDLLNKEWEGKIAVRSKENVYNQSLLASIIANVGEEAALEWVQGVVSNMYQAPKGNDRDQVKAVYAGKADLAIVNTYYVGQMLNSDDEVERLAANSIKVLYPNQDNRGAHINVSGGGVLKFSQNKENAKKLLEFLLEKESQKVFAEANYEFPVHKEVEASEDVQSWGDFKEDQTPLSKIGELNTKAIKLFDKGVWK